MTPGGSVAVAPGPVDVWLEPVDQRDLSGSLCDLDDDELARAERFRFARDRDRFLARRVFLRRTLAGCLGVEPGAIRYRLSPRGRPELAPEYGLTFSASHSHGLAGVAVSRSGRVGIDLERIRPVGKVMDLARQVCSPAEMRHLAGLPSPARGEAFLDLWTRKEAYVKAIGTGLSVPPADVDLGWGSDGPSWLAASNEPFTLTRLADLVGFVGSVAASGARAALRLHAPAAAA